jgi:hypothetical protein
VEARGLAGLARFWRRRSRRARARLIVYPTLLTGVLFVLLFTMSMPGASFRGELPPLDDEERLLAAALRREVVGLAGDIGERHMERPGTLDRALQRIDRDLGDAGYETKLLRFVWNDRSVANIEATRAGRSLASEVVVVGAHYDTAIGAPGADDNASGVAVLVALARAFAERPEPRTIRFVAFVNEEPPHFWNESMGSLHYAKACKERGDTITAMVSLESLGYYRREKGTQKYPPVVSWFYPDRGDFVAFVGNLGSRSLVRTSLAAFREAARFPSEGAAMPSFVTGVGWSDQWSFWQVGYPGVMVTDTAPFRNPHYHTATDTPDKLDYESLARVTAGLVSVVARLARP